MRNNKFVNSKFASMQLNSQEYSTFFAYTHIQINCKCNAVQFVCGVEKGEEKRN